MNQKTIALLNIVIALVFALAIILVSALYPEYSPNSTYIILVLWIIPSTILNILASRK